jgi:hypothetical protein
VCCQVAQQIVSGAPGRAALKPATLGFLQGTLRYNSLDCLMCTGLVRWANRATVTWRQRSTATVNSVQLKSEQRSQSTPDISGVHQTVRCNYRTNNFNSQLLQTPTTRADVAHTGQWTVIVRCAHRQQKWPTTRKWLEAISTPNHLLQWHLSFLKFLFNTREIAFTPRHIPQIKSSSSLKINSTT